MIERQKTELESARGAAAAPADGEADKTVTTAQLLEMLQTQQQTIDKQQALIDELKEKIETLEAKPEDDGEEYIYYTVKLGDTLGRICAGLGIDYWKNRTEILSLNNIRNEHVIRVGQQLMGPSYMKRQ